MAVESIFYSVSGLSCRGALVWDESVKTPRPLLLMAPLVWGRPWEFDSAFANAYAAVPFLCWLPNLVLAEWLIRRRGLPSYRLPA